MSSSFVPAPIGGINRVAPPTQLQPNQARQLDNYFIYDWGIRERGPAAFIDSADYQANTGIFSFTSKALELTLFVKEVGSGTLKVYESDGTISDIGDFQTDASYQDGVGFSDHRFYDAFIYKGHVMVCFPHGGYVLQWRMSDDEFSAYNIIGGPGPGYNRAFTGAFVTGFAFKNRAYFLASKDVNLYYGGVGAISGSTSTFDISEFFQRGNYLTWGASWSYNQGDINDELLVVGNDAGEVFIYSGDYPGADNWGLITRIDIPTPLRKNAEGGIEQQFTHIVKVGQDVLIPTTRGIVSLSRVVAGRERGESYYIISRNLGPVIYGYKPAISRVKPFVYYIGEGGVYVLNYERGAWSRITLDTNYTAGAFQSLSCSGPPLNVSEENTASSFLLIGEYGANGSGLWRIDEDDLVGDANANYVWKTPFFDFGTEKQKQSRQVRVISRDMGEDGVKNSVGISVDLDDSVVGNTDTRTETVSDQNYIVQELEPPGCGEYISYVWSKTGDADQANEIAGFRAFYDKGGEY